MFDFILFYNNTHSLSMSNTFCQQRRAKLTVILLKNGQENV